MEAVKRRAPKEGYDNDVKMEYRHKVWSTLAPKVKDKLKEDSNAKVLLLPSKEGIEIDVAIEYGINPEQIIAIDENPALLAHAQWKDKIPKENRFGCKVSKIGKKIEEKGWYLAGANLDFCNTFSEELINEINTFFKNTPIWRRFSFCVTMGKGRESKALYLLLKHIDTPDIFKHDRLATLYEMMNLGGFYKNTLDYKDTLGLDFEESYYSTFPMIYACFTLHPFHNDVFLKEKERYEILSTREQNLRCATISKNRGESKRKLNEIKDTVRKMKSGSYFKTGYYKDRPPSEERKKELIEREETRLAKQKRYHRQRIGYNNLQDKRRNLVYITSTQTTELLDSIRDMLRLYSKKNGIINPDKYISGYMRFFCYSKIKEGKLK